MSAFQTSTPVKMGRSLSQTGLIASNSPSCIARAEEILRSCSEEKSESERKRERMLRMNLNKSTEIVKPEKLKELEKSIKTRKFKTKARILEFIMNKELAVENVEKKRRLIIKLKRQQQPNSHREPGEKAEAGQKTLDTSGILIKKIRFFPTWLQNREDFKSALTEKISKDMKKRNESEMRWKVLCKSFDARTKEENVLIFEWLKSNYFCRSLPTALVMELMKWLVPAVYEEGETICNQGDVGDCLYIIHKGEVDVIIGSLVVATCHTGEVLGRQGLENSQPRNATLRANSRVESVKLYQEEYKKVVQGFFQNEKKDLFYFVSKLPLFEDFPFSVIEKFTVKAFGQFFYKNDVIYAQGAVAETFYIIVSGKICCQNFIDLSKYNQWPCNTDLWRLIKIGKTMKHNTIMKPGEFFGEEELIDNRPRSQRMVAEEDSLCYCMNKDDFFHIFCSKDIIKFQKNSRQKPKNCLKLIKQQIIKEESDMKLKRDTLLTAVKMNNERSRSLGFRPNTASSNSECWGKKFDKDFKSFLQHQSVLKRSKDERLAKHTALRKDKEEIFSEELFIVS